MADFQRFAYWIGSFFLKEDTADADTSKRETIGSDCKRPSRGNLSARCNPKDLARSAATYASSRQCNDARDTTVHADCENPGLRSDDLHSHVDHRKTKNDMPSLISTNSNARVHWFDGQENYRGSKHAMSSDSWARLESFLASRNIDELKALDPTFGKHIERNDRKRST